LLAPDDPELEALLARSYVVSPGADPSPGWPHVARACEALPGRQDLLLDKLALAALLGRDAEANEIFDAHFRDALRPELARAARHALLVGDVRAANQLLAHGDYAGAEARLRASRERLADDAEVARAADSYIDQLHAAAAGNRATANENAAIGEYNAGVRAANAARYAEAAAAFRRAAAASGRDAFRHQALRKAVSMDLHVRGERAMALARSGDVAQALALLQGMDRAGMSEEDRRWLDHNVGELKRMAGR
jgi:hypothetical protein